MNFKLICIPSERSKESIFHILRDSGRFLLWIVSGRTGARFKPHFRSPVYASR